MRAAAIAVSGAIAAFAAACHGGSGAHAPEVRVEPGVTVHVYTDGEATVDDCRHVEVAAGEPVAIAGLAAAADPATITVVALDGAPLEVGACRFDARAGGLAAADVGRDVEVASGGRVYHGRLEHIDGAAIVLVAGDRARRIRRDAVDAVRLAGDGAPTLRCDVTGAAGRRLVRVGYATGALRWRAAYTGSFAPGAAGEEGEAGAGRARVIATATIADGAGLRAAGATVVLHGGSLTEGGGRTLWRGPLDLEPGETGVTIARLEGPAHVEHVYRGAVTDASGDVREPSFGSLSHSHVDRVLVVDRAGDTPLPAGAALVSLGDDAGEHLAGTVEATAAGEPLRLDLGSSPDLFGRRLQVHFRHTDAGVREGLRLIIENRGDARRTVRVLEPLQRSPDARVLEARPEKPRREDDALVFDVEVDPGELGEVFVVIDYRI